MAVSLAWLAVESGVGIAVFVRCFTDKAAIEDQIGEKLGYGLSRALFAAIGALGTALSMLASVPLGELFFFHMILIRKVGDFTLLCEALVTFFSIDGI
jgi:hypothetical protein